MLRMMRVKMLIGWSALKTNRQVEITGRMSYRLRVIAIAVAISLSMPLLGRTSTAQTQEDNTSIPASEVLRFDFSIKLPSPPLKMAWSPDQKYIAISEFRTGNVRLIDVEHRQVAETILARGDAMTVMAWSPDSQFLAIVYTHQVRLVSRAGEEIASILNPTPECRIPVFEETASIAFTSDGKALWAACGVDDVHAPFVGAIKISVPSLQIAASRVFGIPEHGTRSGAFNYRLNNVGESVVASSILLSFTEGNPIQIRNYINVQDLDSGRQLFPFLPLKYPSAATNNLAHHLAIGGDLVAAIWAVESDRPTIQIVDATTPNKSIFLRRCCCVWRWVNLTRWPSGRRFNEACRVRLSKRRACGHWIAYGCVHSCPMPKWRRVAPRCCP